MASETTSSDRTEFKERAAKLAAARREAQTAASPVSGSPEPAPVSPAVGEAPGGETPEQMRDRKMRERAAAQASAASASEAQAQPAEAKRKNPWQSYQDSRAAKRAQNPQPSSGQPQTEKNKHLSQQRGDHEWGDRGFNVGEQQFVASMLGRQAELQVTINSISDGLCDKSFSTKASHKKRVRQVQFELNKLIVEMRDLAKAAKPPSRAQYTRLVQYLNNFGYRPILLTDGRVACDRFTGNGGELEKYYEIQFSDISQPQKEMLVGLGLGAALGVGASVLALKVPELQPLVQGIRVAVGSYALFAGALPSAALLVSNAPGVRNTSIGRSGFALGLEGLKIRNTLVGEKWGALLAGAAMGFSGASMATSTVFGEINRSHMSDDLSAPATEPTGVVPATPEPTPTGESMIVTNPITGEDIDLSKLFEGSTILATSDNAMDIDVNGDGRVDYQITKEGAVWVIGDLADPDSHKMIDWNTNAFDYGNVTDLIKQFDSVDQIPPFLLEAAEKQGIVDVEALIIQPTPTATPSPTHAVTPEATTETTATPSPTASPSATPEATATATVTPTATSTAEPTSTATVEPTSTATPAAKWTPTPAATATTEPTAEAQATLHPTTTPTAEATPVAPEAQPTPTALPNEIPAQDLNDILENQIDFTSPSDSGVDAQGNPYQDFSVSVEDHGNLTLRVQKIGDEPTVFVSVDEGVTFDQVDLDAAGISQDDLTEIIQQIPPAEAGTPAAEDQAPRLNQWDQSRALAQELGLDHPNAVADLIRDTSAIHPDLSAEQQTNLAHMANDVMGAYADGARFEPDSPEQLVVLLNGGTDPSTLTVEQQEVLLSIADGNIEFTETNIVVTAQPTTPAEAGTPAAESPVAPTIGTEVPAGSVSETGATTADAGSGSSDAVAPGTAAETGAAEAASSSSTVDMEAPVKVVDSVWETMESVVDEYEATNGTLGREQGVVDFLKDAHEALKKDSTETFTLQELHNLIEISNATLVEHVPVTPTEIPESFNDLTDLQKLIIALNLDNMELEPGVKIGLTAGKLLDGDIDLLKDVVAGKVNLDSPTHAQMISDEADSALRQLSYGQPIKY